MASPFHNALTVAARTLESIAGQPITYKPVGGSPFAVANAVMGENSYTVEDDNGIRMRVKVVDWLIDIAEFATPPINGDQIEQTVGGVVRTFQVGPVGDSPCHKFSGPAYDRYRIHSRLIKEVNDD